MSLRSKLSVLALALSLGMPALAVAADLKLAYVDYQQVLLEVDDGKAAKARLQKWMESREKELGQEQDNLRKEKETLEKQASAMSEEVRAQKAADFQKKYMDLVQKLDKSRSEAAEKERSEMQPIMAKIDGVIRGIADRDGLSMVFDKQGAGIVYALGQYDLTNEVIRTYNSNKGGKAPAKDAPVAKDAPKK